jgi:hypothetical protein
MTNFEKIKNMSVNEMTEFFAKHQMCSVYNICEYECNECFKKWLESESEV